MAVNMFWVMDPVTGESQDSDFKSKNAIDIFSFSLGASNPSSVATGSGSSAGKVSISSISVQKVVDKASPDLFVACCNGTHFDKATLTVREAGGKSPVDYMVIDFEEVYVDSVSWGGASGGEKPSESVSFSFGKIHYQYNIQDAKGMQQTGGEMTWDLRGNTAG